MVIFARSTTVAALLGFAVTAVHAAVTKLDPSGLQLVAHTDRYKSIIAKLDDALPNVSVEDVLDDTNHATPGYSGPSNFVQDFTWEHVSGYDDLNTDKWYPQGITTSADAYDAGTYKGRNMILVSWYDHRDVPKADNKGVRISFIDADKKAYRNVLLVVPGTESDGTATFSSVKVHAGGIMLYGNILYIVDTANGLRLFDLNHIYKVDTGNGIGHVGKGVYQAFTYKYVIPQLGYYKAQGSVGDGFRFSYLALDRTTTPDSVIVGEYDSKGVTNRIARFNLDYKTRFLTDSTAVATELYNMGLKSVQGAVSANGVYYFSCSRGASTKGDLYTWKGEGTTPVRHAGVMSIGCEDLSYRKQGDQLWSLGEHPGTRPVYAVKASSYK